jgi:hypothetical protein
MGNKASAATIAVTFDRTDTTPGETATGKVYLSVNQPQVECVSVGCRIVGQESTQVTYTTEENDIDGKSHTTTHTATEKRNFLYMQFCLQQVPGGSIQNGQFEYPFQFTVPAGCPASMASLISKYGSDGFNIQYYVEAWLDRPGMMRWDIRNKQIFTVYTRPSTSTKTPIYMEPCPVYLNTFFCVPRGYVVLGGAAESSVLCAGENTVIKYAVQNNSAVNIKAVEVIIEQKVMITAQGHRETGKTVLFKKRLTAGECKADLSALVGNPLDQEQTWRKLTEVLRSDLTDVPVVIPQTACCTYYGSIVCISHEMTIKVCTGFGCSNPSVTRPITMYSRGNAQSVYDAKDGFAPPPALPAGWSPVVAQAVVFPAMARTSAASAVTYVEPDEHAKVVYATAPEVPVAVASASSLPQLLQTLRSSYDPVGDLSVYIKNGGRLDDMQENDFFQLFSAVNDIFDQQRVADVVAANLTSITCGKVARAAAGTKDMCRREVVEKLLAVQPLVDKQNAGEVYKQLTAFQAMTVERYFKK